MRVAVFTNTYRPTVNGVVNSIEAFRKGLEQTGHQVFVFAPQAHEPVEDEDFIFRFPAWSLGRYPDYPVALPLSRSVGRAFCDLSVDVVHTQHPWLIGQRGLRLAHRTGAPVVTTIHTQYEQYAHYGWPIPRTLLHGVLRRTVRSYCQQCETVATPGAAMKEYLLRLGITQPIEIVPNATDLSGFDTADGRGVREAWGIAPTEVLFTFVGRAAKEKNLHHLIQAFGIVAAEMPEARLMIVGGGPMLSRLNRLAADQPCSDRIALTGLVPYEGIKAYHAAADVFVTASVTEVQPLSLNEAMAARTPVAGFDAGGINDMVRDGETGLLAPPAEGVGGLARVMLELGRDENRRLRLAEAAQRASRKYHIPQATERLLKVYRMAMDSHGRNP